MRHSTSEKLPIRGALGDELLSCFQRASSEGHSEVAEHVLVALEHLSKEEAGAADPERHAQLAEAYRSIIAPGPPATAHRRAVEV